MAAAVRLIDAATVASALRPADWLAAARRAFELYGTRVAPPPPLAIALPDGSAHVKAAALPTPESLLTVKLNANLPRNPERFGLPTIQGLVLVYDAAKGTPLAICDSASLTAWRTAAASALACELLATPGADTAAIVGCGVQGHAHAVLLASVLRLKRLRLFDRDPARARALPKRLAPRAAFTVETPRRLAATTRDAAVVACCTSSYAPYLALGDVAKGALVAAVGADHPAKRELRDDLLAAATLVVDSRTQASVMGEWHHVPGAAKRPPELGELVRDERRLRRRRSDIVVFDSTGFGLQDACALAVLLKRTRKAPSFRFAT